MNRALLFRAVLQRLGRFKLKTFLMGLGIAISVLATVLLQGAAVGVRGAFDRFISRMYPADGVFLMAGGGFMGGKAGATKLELDDVETVAASLGITQWDPILMVGGREVTREGNGVRVPITGTSEKAESVRGRSVQEGEFLTAADVRGRARVALIGKTTASELFPNGSPVGEQVFIDNVPFEVKGVLESVGVDPHGGDQDQAIQIPYTTLMENVARVDFVSGASYIIPDRNRADAVRRQIVDIMRERHQIGPGQDDDFTVITPVLMNEMVNKFFRTFNIFIPLIAATAFAISAAVVMSIMQLGIRARKAEIGLRKAVGARDRDLQLQLVLEVLVVAAFASAAGLVLAFAGSELLTPVLAARFGVKHVSPSALVCLIATLAAMVASVLGVLLPARRAARLDPVIALR